MRYLLSRGLSSKRGTLDSKTPTRFSRGFGRLFALIFLQLQTATDRVGAKRSGAGGLHRLALAWILANSCDESKGFKSSHRNLRYVRVVKIGLKVAKFGRPLVGCLSARDIFHCLLQRTPEENGPLR